MILLWSIVQFISFYTCIMKSGSIPVRIQAEIDKNMQNPHSWPSLGHIMLFTIPRSFDINVVCSKTLYENMIRSYNELSGNGDLSRFSSHEQ